MRRRARAARTRKARIAKTMWRAERLRFSAGLRVSTGTARAEESSGSSGALVAVGSEAFAAAAVFCAGVAGFCSFIIIL